VLSDDFNTKVFKEEISNTILNKIIGIRGGRAELFDYEYSSVLLMQDMAKALDRIRKAVSNGEKISLVGDYDCDGLTSVAMLARTLSLMGAEDVNYYIPNRHTEGYGINQRIVDKIESGIAILVDNGITAVDLVSELTDKGVDVIIIEHHIPGKILPNAYALINAKVEIEPPYYPHRCTAGIVGDMCVELCPQVPLPFIYTLQAIGTVADVVPLQRDNRDIVKRGLALYKFCGVPTLISLLSAMQCSEIDTYAIGFKIAPCINAVGRLGYAYCVVEALMGNGDLSDYLVEMNMERRKLEAEFLARHESKQYSNEVILLMDDTVDIGIVGSLAGKLQNKYSCPAIVLSNGVASGRSGKGFDLYSELLTFSERLFERFGGHNRALSFRINPDRVAELEELIENIKVPEIEQSHRFDILIDFDAVSFDLCKSIETLEPFGEGNPKPIFCSKNVRVKYQKFVGRAANVLLMKLGNKNISAVAFNQQDKPPSTIDITYTIKVDRFAGERPAVEVLDWGDALR